MRIIFRIMLLFRTLQGTLWFGDETRLPKHVGQARPNAPHGTGWNLLSNQWATLRKKGLLRFQLLSWWISHRCASLEMTGKAWGRASAEEISRSFLTFK
jgi:hypothetical protein